VRSISPAVLRLADLVYLAGERVGVLVYRVGVELSRPLYRLGWRLDGRPEGRI